MLNEEEKYYELGFKFIVGCDEAGREFLTGISSDTLRSIWHKWVWQTLIDHGTDKLCVPTPRSVTITGQSAMIFTLNVEEFLSKNHTSFM